MTDDDWLDRVSEAANDRRAADRQYHDVILSARHIGHTLAAIAAAAGITRQAVWEMIRRHEEHKP